MLTIPVKRFLYLLIITAHSVSAQQHRFDSLKSELKVATDTQERMDLLLDITYDYIFRDKDSAKHYSRIYTNEAKLTGDSSHWMRAQRISAMITFLYIDQELGKKVLRDTILPFARRHDFDLTVTYSYLGNIHFYYQEWDSAKYYYYLSYEHTSDLKKPSKLSKLAELEVVTGDLDIAVDLYIQAIKYAESKNENQLLANYYMNLGKIHANRHQPHTAKKHLIKSLNYAQKLGLNHEIINITTILGYKYQKDFKQYDSAKYYYRLAKQSVDSLGSTQTNVIYHTRMGSLHLDMKNLDSAGYFLKKAYSLMIDKNVTESQRVLFTSLANYYMKLNDYEKADYFLQQADVPLSNDVDQLFTIESEEEQLLLEAQLAEIKGDYKSSVDKYKRYLNFHDSLIAVTYQSRTAELQTQYETEKKDQKIESLTQESIIQSLTLSQRNNQLLIGGLGVLLFISGALLYYRSYRSKKEKAEVEINQRFLRSQLNPHFIFNSMTAIQQYLIENKSMEETSNYMGMFSTLMRQILENSREEFISLKEEVNMLKNYLALQKMRFEEQFTYEIIIGEELDQNYVGLPPMFAQPFIENALEHGLFRDTTKNHIKISFLEKKSSVIDLIIEDSGTGIQETQVASHTSLATKITQERLSILEKNLGKSFTHVSENLVNSVGKVTGFGVRLTLPSKQLI